MNEKYAGYPILTKRVGYSGLKMSRYKELKQPVYSRMQCMELLESMREGIVQRRDHDIIIRFDAKLMLV